MREVDECSCVRSQTCVPIREPPEEGTMEQQQERPDQRNNAFWLRFAVGSLLLCVLISGCWQTTVWFEAHFPKDFR